MIRKIVSVIYISLFLLSSSFAQEADPRLYFVQSETSKVYLLGGTDAPDHSWFTQKIQQAFNESEELWVEIPPQDKVNGIGLLYEDVVPSETSSMHPVAIDEGYGNLSLRDYFDVAMGERSAVEAQGLNLNSTDYQAMQPWLAYYTFHQAFWSRYQGEFEDPELSLVDLGRNSGKAIKSFFEDRAAFFRYMGKMNDYGQTHYFQYLYNTFDWQRSGEYSSRFNWVLGEPDGRWLDSIKNQTPGYYRYRYERYNPVLAEQISELLKQGGSYFIYLDINRTVGDSSVQNKLADLGYSVTRL